MLRLSGLPSYKNVQLSSVLRSSEHCSSRPCTLGLDPLMPPELGSRHHSHVHVDWHGEQQYGVIVVVEAPHPVVVTANVQVPDRETLPSG